MLRQPSSLSAFGQALVDEIFQVSSEQLSALGFSPNEQLQVNAEEYLALRRKLDATPIMQTLGGAIINVLCANATLGCLSKLVIRLGKDSLGEFVLRELSALGVITHAIYDDKAPTGTSVILVSPGGARTMITCLGAANKILPGEITLGVFPQESLVSVEGYIAGIPGSEALLAHRLFHQRGQTLAFVLAAPWLATRFPDAVKEFIEMSSFVFANEIEAATLTSESDPAKAATKLALAGRVALVTAGANGVFIAQDAQLLHVPARAVNVVDSTGAGDSFAGAFLRGYLQGVPLEKCAQAATYVASVVVSQIGARVPISARKGWEQIALGGV